MDAPIPLSRRARQLLAHLRRQATAVWLILGVALACGYFFQGGGWNQNAHFATVVALVEDGTVLLDRYRASTGDLARTEGHMVSAKPVGTAIAAVPGYLVAKLLTLGVENEGNRRILRAWGTAWLTSGAALCGLALLFWRLARRRLQPRPALLLAAAMALATPLWPNSTMLNSHALVSLWALWSFDLLDAERQRGGAFSRPRLLAVGLLAALPAAFEYMAVVVLPVLGLYAWWNVRAWQRLWPLVAGVALALAVPFTHHLLVYGHPLAVGYGSLVVARFADDAAQGFFGFDGFSVARLYELTLGGCRGAFFLSPFLLAQIPGLVVLVRGRRTRGEGVASGLVAWLVLLLVASLVYWHSGSALGSRYALLFVTFSVVGVAATLPRHLPWVGLGAAWGFGVMLIGTSVTAIPPPPPPAPPYPNVLGWLWERFAAGNLASWQEPVLVVDGSTGQPTLPFAFNLGQLAGLPGLWSLLPFAVLLGLIAWRAWAAAGAEEATAVGPPTV